jgi:hypothetical protein
LAERIQQSTDIFHRDELMQMSGADGFWSDPSKIHPEAAGLDFPPLVAPGKHSRGDDVAFFQHAGTRDYRIFANLWLNLCHWLQ